MTKLSACLTALLVCGMAFGGDSSQWRGENRDGRFVEQNLLDKWPQDGPELIWSKSGIGAGFSSVAVADGKIYITGMIGKDATMTCFDLAGKQLWAKSYGPEWKNNYPGSRSTPTVNQGFVYALSGEGNVVCLDAKSGAEKWSRNVLQEFKGKNISWGVSESLLIDGQNLICTPGGTGATVVALEKKTGKNVWQTKGLSDLSAYCSPVLIKQGTTNLIVTMTSDNIVGIDAKSGNVFWKYPYKNKYAAHPVSPLFNQGCVYVTSGYGSGGVMLLLSPDGKSVSVKWKNVELDTHHGGVVLHNGLIYGSSYNGKWMSLAWNTGEIKDRDGGVGKGSVVFADGMLYCYGERGEMGLVDPAGLKVVSKFKITRGQGQHWAHPAIADGRMYIRHGEELLVYKISK
jgi:outer membrane protein assembly factor BamB